MRAGRDPRNDDGRTGHVLLDGSHLLLGGSHQRGGGSHLLLGGSHLLLGSSHLDANAALLAGRSGKKTFFNWQWTTDGGRTFNNAPSTPLASTTIGNLPPLTTVGFRVSVTTRKGPGEWSQIVTILIL